MVDRLFSDAELARLYDVLHPWEERADFRFYLPRVMSAQSVLDVGCGTGALLHRAREAGHTGRLCGLDPAPGMLEQARKRRDIEWILGDLTSIGPDQRYDLIVMTGHAFQVFLEDDELLAALRAIRSALTSDGRFAFETRNPGARAWEDWTPENPLEAVDESGAALRLEHRVETPVAGDFVRFSSTFTSPDWDQPQVSWSTLRFPDADSLAPFLSSAGLAIEEQFGDWTGEPLAEKNPEIITVARRA